MDLGLLDSEEIKHELLIRGMEVEGSIRILAGRLKKIMQEENEGSRKKEILVINTPSQEYEICEEKIKEIGELIQSDKGKRDFLKQNRAVAKGEYVRNRLDMLRERAPELRDCIDKLIGNLNGIMSTLVATNSDNNSQAALYNRDRTSNISLESINLLDVDQSVSNSSFKENRSERQTQAYNGAISKTPRYQNNYEPNWGNRPNFKRNPHISHVVGSVPPNRPRRSQNFSQDTFGNHAGNHSIQNNREVASDIIDVRKLSSIPKWNVSFNGLSHPISVEQFIMRIEILARSEDLPLDSICLSMHHLLTGIASNWFWVFVSKNRNVTWNSFRGGLMGEFQTLTSDHEIRRKMENRRQKSRESFTEFKLVMESMNTELRIPYSDNELVSVLMNNMHPALKKLLVLSKPISLNELKVKCLQVEKMLGEVGETFEDQIVGRRKIVNEVGISKKELEGNDDGEYQVEENNLSICWNCDDIGHNFQDCPSYMRNLFCYSCGYKNVTKPNCPRCRSNLNLERGVRKWRAPSQPLIKAQQPGNLVKIVQRPAHRQSGTQTDA